MTSEPGSSPGSSLRFAVASIKGGVGKTSSAINLAYAAALAGRSTVVWDLDPQGASTWSLGVGRRVPGGGRRLITAEDPLVGIATTETLGLDVLPADFSLRHLDVELHKAGRPKKRVRGVLKRLSERYEVVIVDCPPGITLQIESLLHGVDAVAVPVPPESLALRTVDQLKAYMAAESKLDGVKVLPFLSMVDRRRVNHRRFLAELSNDDRSELLATSIPISVDVERIGFERRPVAHFAPKSRAVVAFRELWEEIEAHTTLDLRSWAPSESSEPSDGMNGSRRL